MIISMTDDFDLDRIGGSGQCFRWNKNDKNDDESYRIIAGDLCLNIMQFRDDRYELDCSEADFNDFWRDYFDLGEDYRSIRRRIDPERDPFLRQAAEHEKGIRILRQDPFEMYSPYNGIYQQYMFAWYRHRPHAET